MIAFNDWPIKKCLVFSGSLLLAQLGLTVLAALGCEIPVLRQIIGFCLLSFIPGLLLLRILRIHNVHIIEGLLYAVGLSLAFFMATGVIANFAMPPLGISRPMTLIPLTATMVALIFILMIIAYFRDRNYRHPVLFTPAVKISMPAVLLLILLPLLTILSVQLIDTYQNNTLLIVCLLAVAAIVILAAFNKFITPDLYPLAIFVIGLCLLYQTTLMSPYPVGNDIYVEYNFYQLVAKNGIWDYTIGSTVNSCLSITILAPVYSLFMNIDAVWAFKAIYPLLFALVPLILYRVFSQQIGRRKGFLAAFFFIIVPTFSLELIALCRQQVAELFLALFILALIDKRISTLNKLILTSLFSASVIVSHYATGFIGFIYMGLFLPFILIISSNWFRSIWSWLSAKSDGLPPQRKQLPLVALCIIVAVYFVAGLAWYALIGSGANWGSLSWLWNKQTGTFASSISSLLVGQTAGLFDFSARDVLIRTALGLDFFQASLQGKIFRVFQLATQLLLILGILRLIFKPKGLNFAVEYLSPCVTGCLLLAVSIFLPGFVEPFNTTRMYHIALITLAPFCILGGEVIWLVITRLWRKLKYAKHAIAANPAHAGHDYPAFITLIVLIPYFLLTSGLVYEVTRQEVTDSIDTPYSIALSSYRLDLAGLFCRQDGAAAEWLSQNSDNSTSLITDTHARRIIKFYGFPGPFAGVSLDNSLVAADSYIYFTKWNIDKNELTFATYTGLRRHYSFNDVPGLIEAVNTRDSVYNNGGARILAPINLNE